MNHKDDPAPTVPADFTSDAQNNSRKEPTKLGHFVIRDKIGQGGMGIVYRAYDEQLNRDVALKILPPHARESRQAVLRFQIEAQATARLNHEHIVEVYEVAEDAGIPYYAMKLIRGTNLSAVLKSTRTLLSTSKAKDAQKSTVPITDRHSKADDTKSDFSGKVFHLSHQEASAKSSANLIRSVAMLGSQIAKALDHAHQNAIIHRDVKPSNILIDDDNKVWLSDFGLAQMRDAPSITRSRDLLGTYRYMSPEQALGGRSYIDHRTDIYSLGATLYELATLQPICAGKTEIEILQQLHFGRPIPLRKVNPKLSKDFEIVISKATERSPNDRYATAADFADDLLRVAKGLEITTKKVSPLKRSTDWLLNRPQLSFGIFSGTILTFLLLLWATIFLAGQQKRTKEALKKMTAQRMIAEMALKLDSDPGGAIAIGVNTPGIEHDPKGLNVLMHAIDNCHEVKTIQLRQRFPGRLAWNPNLDLLLVCTDVRRFGTEDKAQFVDTKTKQLSEELNSSESVTSAAFSSKGNFLLTAGSTFGPTSENSFEDADFSAPILWDAKNKKRLRQFPDARIAICNDECFSPDGRWIALPSKLSGAQLYSLINESENISLQYTKGHQNDAVMGTAFSNDQRFVATWTNTGHVAVFDAKNGDRLKEFSVDLSKEYRLNVTFSPDASWLIASSDKGTLLLQTDDWSAPHIFRSESKSCFVGPNHDVALIFSKTCRLFNPDFEVVTQEIELPELTDELCPIGNSNSLAIRNQGSAFIVDFNESEVTANLFGHSDRIIDLKSPVYAELIASVSWDGTCRFWNKKSNRELREFPATLSKFPSPIIGYSKDGQRAVIGPTRHSLTRLFRSGKPGAISDITGSVKALLQNANIVTESNGTLRQYDAQSLNLVSRVSIDESVDTIEEITGVGVVISTNQGSIFLWDLRSPVATKLNSSGSVMRTCLVPQTAKLIAASGEDLLLLDIEQSTQTTISSALTSKAVDLEVAPNQSEVAVLTSDRVITVWNLTTNAKRGSIRLPKRASDIRYATDGKTLLAYEGGLGKDLILLDSESLTVEQEFQLQHRIRDLNIAGNGKACCIATQSGIFLWDIGINAPKLIKQCDCLWGVWIEKDLWFAERPSQAQSNLSPDTRTLLKHLPLDDHSLTKAETEKEYEIPFRATDLRYSSSSKDLLVACSSAAINVLDVEQMSQEYSIQGLPLDFKFCNFGVDSDTVITVSKNGSIVSNHSDNKKSFRIGQQSADITAAAISPDRETLIVSDKSGRLTGWNTEQQDDALEYDSPSVVQHINFGGKNKRFLTVHADNKVSIWQRENSKAVLIHQSQFDQPIRTAYLGPNSSSYICLFGDPRAYVSPSRYLSIANNNPEETRAVLVDLVSGTEKNLSSQTEFADCLFAASGNQLAVLDFDGKVKLYDLADAKEQDPKTISSTIIRRLLAIDAKSQTVFGLSGSSIIGINTQDGNSEFELSGVVPPLKINTEYDRWQLNLPNDSPLILVRDLRAISYPRSPLNHAQQMAPRGLTEQERNEFFLSQ